MPACRGVSGWSVEPLARRPRFAVKGMRGMATSRSLLKSEDWMSLWLALFIFALSIGLLGGLDLLSWAVKTKV